MYTNKCTKCGKEFETKNPKRIICPSCLYPDRASVAPADTPAPQANAQSYPRSYSAGNADENNYKRPFNRDNIRPGGGFNRPQGQGGFRPRQDGGQGGFRPGGGFNRPQGQGGFRPGGGFNRPQGQGGFRPGGGGFRKPSGPPRPLLVNKEQLAQIEELYRKMLPLPNPDAHEVIGEKISLEPKKVFFGINLVRQKMMLPKISFPKRKLAVSADQLMAIRNLYEPLLPLPPIGCHKIIAAQLKMDEWRVHVGIGLVRKQMGLERWNAEREDAPAEYKNK